MIVIFLYLYYSYPLLKMNCFSNIQYTRCADDGDYYIIITIIIIVLIVVASVYGFCIFYLSFFNFSFSYSV